ASLARMNMPEIILSARDQSDANDVCYTQPYQNRKFALPVEDTNSLSWQQLWKSSAPNRLLCTRRD
ncbi:MAG: hypothetical protein KDE58_05105, partial [Caldilineaceae bacterium]|nr:hypothetical protein [Caldilineaceae bacterium]